MIVASGFVEVDGLNNVEIIVEELKRRGVEINDIEKNKIVILIEGETIDAIKLELDALKNIETVSNVQLAYYSLEGTEDGRADDDNNNE